MNTKIDITQKEPAKREKNWKNSLIDGLFYTVQWTWVWREDAEYGN